MINAERNVLSFLEKQDLSMPLSTAQGVKEVPFQRWYHFKEAFSPQFVVDVIKECHKAPKTICDPFGGSGTTALTAQLLGIKPTTIEVNPFLADLIESKLQKYDVPSVISDWMTVIRSIDSFAPDLQELYKDAPRTLFKKEGLDRWLFDQEVLTRIVQYLLAINELQNQSSKTLLKVLLGSILIPLSNVVISGKGRRYRKNWQALRWGAHDVDEKIRDKVNNAIYDITKYDKRKSFDYNFLRGDSRSKLKEVAEQDLVLFSPPYPNTFDYTDIYNVELWVLGYLSTTKHNRELRESTLQSHVAAKIQLFQTPSSKTLLKTKSQLDKVRDNLWNKNIPEMVCSYFSDIEKILRESYRILPKSGMAVIVIGDSKYQNIKIDTKKITTEIANEIGFRFNKAVKIRVMKSSVQQGCAKDLDELAIFYQKI